LPPRGGEIDEPNAPTHLVEARGDPGGIPLAGRTGEVHGAADATKTTSGVARALSTGARSDAIAAKRVRGRMRECSDPSRAVRRST
jgi:hypothetical protein